MWANAFRWVQEVVGVFRRVELDCVCGPGVGVMLTVGGWVDVVGGWCRQTELQLAA